MSAPINDAIADDLSVRLTRSAAVDPAGADQPARKIELINVLLVGVVFLVVFLSYFVNHRIAGMHSKSTELTEQSTRTLSTLVSVESQLESMTDAVHQLQAGVHNQGPILVRFAQSTAAIEDLFDRLKIVGRRAADESDSRAAANGIQRIRSEGAQIVLNARNLLSAPELASRLGPELIERASSETQLLLEQHTQVLATLEQAAKSKRDEANGLLIVQYGVLVAVPPLIAMFLFYQMLLANRGEKLEREKVWYLSALEAKQKELEDQQREVAAARDDAVRASLAKSAFVANMSHEIRTPLTAIIGFSDISLTHSGSGSDHLDSLNMVNRSAKHLLQIINDILDLSKIEADKLQIDPVETSLFSVVDDVTHICNLQAELKGLVLTPQFDFPIPARVQIDSLRLKQILLNLTNNALKFTERGGVTLRCGYNQGIDEVWFEIKDTGIGIAPEQMARLFSAFSQADASTTRRFGGTGLGLYLCKKLVALLGGELTATSEPGQGTSFRFTAKAPQVAGSEMVADATKIAVAVNEPAVAALGSWAGRGKILLAEDNPINQKLIGLYFKRLGIEFDVADDGKQAYEMALAKDYVLVLMDMQMPVMDGYEATGQLRERGYTGPIVALTANAMKEDIDKAIGAGCDDFLTKPIDQKEFARVFAEYLPN